MNAIAKNQIRRHFRRQRLQLSSNTRKKAQAVIIRRLKPLIRRGHRIALYWPTGSELSLLDLIPTAQQRGAHIYLPYIERKRLRLWFTPYRPGLAAERPLSRPAIPQFTGRRIRADKLHTLMIPLIAVDHQGFRLGQGGGYYDATLQHCRTHPRRIAAGFACQLADRLPHEAHDCPVHTFISEQHHLHFRTTSKPNRITPNTL